MPLPRLAMTLGDVAGIGPEVVARACAAVEVRECCRPVVFGHPDVLRRAVELAGARMNVVAVDQPVGDDAQSATRRREPHGGGMTGGSIACWNPAGDEAAEVPAGIVDARAGQAAYACLIAAIDAALAGEVDAIVTAPINKAALHLGGHRYPGHTEILAERCGSERFAMMLYLPREDARIRKRTNAASAAADHTPPNTHHAGLAVAHVTLHTSIHSVPELLTTANVREKIELTAGFLHRIGVDVPRIGVCALNPHAGENGLFGDEEPRIIAPGADEARWQLGETADVSGPLPADTLFRRAIDGEFDGVVAMYHDQGHIALKLAGFGCAVNVTLGLPIVRTSPSHGTAFDIAWQGQARAEGMIDAIRLAARLVSGEW